MGGGPQPAQLFLQGRARAAERAHGLLERWHAGGVSAGERRRQAVEQEIGGRGGPVDVGDAPRRLRRFAEAAGCETAREMAGQHGVEVGLPGHAQVEGLEPPGGPEQQRGRVAAAVLRVGDLGPDHVHLGALELSQRPCLGGRQQPPGGFGSTREVLGLGRGQGTASLRRGVQAELDRAVQERRRGGEPASALGAGGRSLEFGRDLLVGTDGRLRQVPGAAVGIEIGIGRRRQDDMDPAAIVR